MKKITVLFLCALLCASCLSGCFAVFTQLPEAGGINEEIIKPTDPVEEKDTLPGSYPMEFCYSSGAGAWATYLTLQADGSFEGVFHDTNMGEMEEGYPNGTVYICNFEGKFGNIKRIDDCSYKMTLENMHAEKSYGEEWIRDGVRYVASAPYGLDTGTEFVMYTPETKVDGLSEAFLGWWPQRMTEGEQPDTLMCYGIYNIDAGTGFFTYE